jgi:hypothetical protein
MSREYSNPKRANDVHSLPDIEVFQLTAEEQVQQDEDLMWEALKQFPLASMNSRERDKAIEWAVEESGATGGYLWWSWLPGCLPDGPPNGPFETYADALADAREGIEDLDEDEDEDEQ